MKIGDFHKIYFFDFVCFRSGLNNRLKAFSKYNYYLKCVCPGTNTAYRDY